MLWGPWGVLKLLVGVYVLLVGVIRRAVVCGDNPTAIVQPYQGLLIV
jgi:hypothetical protein